MVDRETSLLEEFGGDKSDPKGVDHLVSKKNGIENFHHATNVSLFCIQNLLGKL